MTKPAWKPWHKVVEIREDLKTGELSLATFAADLYDVTMAKARPVYQDPEQFFALTYPTFNLRELAKDVIHRLARKNEKAVRQLELTYGGGKTHTLITLLHLVQDPGKLPKLPAVDEFSNHIGISLPSARVAAVVFDKLDVEKGMEVRSPNAETRWLKNPWSVLAFQIAGPDGLKLLHADGKEEERESAPAENLLVDLLALPEKDDQSTLILLDEVLMYAREKIGLDPVWRSRLVNFFQYLTQAATKVDRCAVVASLLATDPSKSDQLGKEITQELYAIFRREREEGVQPVVKEDVAEVLRRRFFTPRSIVDREAFRSHVVAALKGITELDEQTRKDGKIAEECFLKNYPFHPDLSEVFYTKWTNLEGFQRTRGILRTFALALRDAEQWDESPLIGVNVFLGNPEKPGISEAARELTTVAGTEEYEGKKQEWTGILEGELSKAREIQSNLPGLEFREVEQGVFATFLHSQPIGQRALTRDLMTLLGHTRPDKIEIEKALRQWAEVSWFLDEGVINDAEVDADGRKLLPKAWRLGSKPNLRQMHDDARKRISPEFVEARLLDEIGKLKSLTAGASAAGSRVHNLPERPRDIEDNGEFHFAVIGPSAASESSKPSPEARRFLDETTASDRPRVYRNSVLLAVPSRDGLEVVRNQIRDYLAWEEVRSQLKEQEIDPIRQANLIAYTDESRKKVPAAIRQAYCIVVTVSEKNEDQAFKITISDKPMFLQIKEDSRSRIQETAIDAEALLPGGPYDFWRKGEISRRVKDLVGAFAQFPRLPKMLNRKAIQDTIVLGCVSGQFVLRSIRPDRSERALWRRTPEDADLKDPGLEVVLPEFAKLTEISSGVLIPGTLPELWERADLIIKDLYGYFEGGKTVKIKKEGYDEPIMIPAADKSVVDEAVRAAVKEGKLWLTSGPASILSEDIPAGILTEDAVLQMPPQPVPVGDILLGILPESWSDEVTTALAISTALSKKAGKTLPWSTVREAIDGAFRARLLERALDSGPWPCDFAGSGNVKLRVLKEQPIPPPLPPPPKRPGVLIGEAELRPNQIQDLADQIPEIAKAAVGLDLEFTLKVELEAKPESAEAVEKIGAMLAEISKDLEPR